MYTELVYEQLLVTENFLGQDMLTNVFNALKETIQLWINEITDIAIDKWRVEMKYLYNEAF